MLSLAVLAVAALALLHAPAHASMLRNPVQQDDDLLTAEVCNPADPWQQWNLAPNKVCGVCVCL